jgi:anti-anti-sigma factor
MTDDPRSPAQPPGPGGGGRAARGSMMPDTTVPPILDQAFDPDSLYSLRAAMAAHAAEAGLSPGRVSDAVAAVHELAANSVRHGAGCGRLRVWNRAGDLHCLVTDDGAAPAGADTVPAGAGAVPASAGAVPAGPDPAGGAAEVDGIAVGPWHTGAGHGLWLVHQLADEVSLQAGPGGSSVAITFALGPPGAGAPFQLAMHSQGGCTIIAATGEFGPRAADQVIDAVDGVMAADAAPQLVLDLAGLTRWDSSGVAALLAVQQRVGARPPARLVLAGLPGRFTQRLRDSGLAARFTVTDTAQDAIRLLASPA